MARVIALLAVVFGLLVGGSPASAIEPPSAAQLMASVHHAPIYDEATSYTDHERGSPDTIHRGTPCDAVDRWSGGPLGRSGTGDPPTAYTYDADATPAKAATSHGIGVPGAMGVLARTNGSVGVIDGKLWSVPRSRTAAKSAPDVSQILLRSPGQLQSKFKHAKDFGVTGNYNPANAATFSAAIHQHINSPGVRVIQGTYHKQPVTHYVDPANWLNVIAERGGTFISGWKLSPGQLSNVLSHGGL